ncbi:MAG: hypothetical protein DWQ49_06510 [Bacteroidetes bacterium]|nr:MAG: hypothetical protein DWQ49_06510 [Bacteroidota bacterium]
MKTGRLSKDEWAFIEFNSDKMSAAQIAKELDRAIEPIQKHLEKLGKGKDLRKNLQTQAEYDLKKRPYWRELQAQFSESELEILLYHWKEIVSQFRKDILATEELQIIDVVKLEVLMNRALREQQYSMNKIAEFDEMIEFEKRKAAEDQDREFIFGLERQIATLRAAKESLSREYKDLQTKKSAMYRDLKATREQRIAKLEDNKETFSGLVQKLVRDPDFVEEQNLYMEKMRLAVMKEQERLSDYHEYEDGTVDQPFLTPETILDESNENARNTSV